MTEMLIGSIKDFFGLPNTKGNRLRALFSKSIHSHSVNVGNNIEIEYILYHTLLNDGDNHIYNDYYSTDDITF